MPILITIILAFFSGALGAYITNTCFTKKTKTRTDSHRTRRPKKFIYPTTQVFNIESQDIICTSFPDANKEKQLLADLTDKAYQYYKARYPESTISKTTYEVIFLEGYKAGLITKGL